MRLYIYAWNNLTSDEEYIYYGGKREFSDCFYYINSSNNYSRIYTDFKYKRHKYYL